MYIVPVTITSVRSVLCDNYSLLLCGSALISSGIDLGNAIYSGLSSCYCEGQSAFNDCARLIGGI